MSLFEEATAIARAGRPHDAVAFIERKAAEGDAEGNVILAHWHLYGSDRPRDLGAARRCLELAASKSSSEAVRILAHLTANGTGGEVDQGKALEMLRAAAAADAIAAEELAMLSKIASEETADRAPREIISDDPAIHVVRGLLNADECAYLMRRAEPLLKPSLVDDPVRGRGVPDRIRTSHGAAFVPHEEDLVVQAINRRLAKVSATNVRHAEALYVMRYTPGQEYRMHHDALRGLENQRAWTAIAYLNDDYDGGATTFPQLGIELRLHAGDLLIFSNVDSGGGPHPLMQHAGEPVTRGAKWIATRWIRSAPHDPYDRQ